MCERRARAAPRRVHARRERRGQREPQGVGELRRRQVQVDLPAEGAAINDAGQHQGGQQSGRNRREERGDAHESGLRQHQQRGTPWGQAERAQDRQLPRAFQLPRQQRTHQPHRGHTRGEPVQHPRNHEGALENAHRQRANVGVGADEERLPPARGRAQFGNRPLRLDLGCQIDAEPADRLIAPQALVLSEAHEHFSAVVTVFAVHARHRKRPRPGSGRQGEGVVGREPQPPGERLGDEDRAARKLRPRVRRVRLRELQRRVAGGRESDGVQIQRAAR